MLGIAMAVIDKGTWKLVPRPIIAVQPNIRWIEMGSVEATRCYLVDTVFRPLKLVNVAQ